MSSQDLALACCSELTGERGPAFAAAPPERVAELLETLVTLGQARAVADERYAAG